MAWNYLNLMDQSSDKYICLILHMIKVTEAIGTQEKLSYWNLAWTLLPVHRKRVACRYIGDLKADTFLPAWVIPFRDASLGLPVLLKMALLLPEIITTVLSQPEEEPNESSVFLKFKVLLNSSVLRISIWTPQGIGVRIYRRHVAQCFHSVVAAVGLALGLSPV